MRMPPRGPFALRWSYPTHGRVDTLLATEGLLVLAVRRSQLAALDATTGVERWRARHLTVQWRELALTNERAFVLGGFEHLTSLDLRTGTPVWRRAVPRFSGWLHAAGTHLLYGGWRGYTPLHAADARTGEVLWHRTLDEAPVRTAMYVPLEAATIVMPGGRVMFLGLNDGQLRHEVNLPGFGQQRPYDGIPREVVGLLGSPLLLSGEAGLIYRLMGEKVTVEARQLGRVPLTHTLQECAGEVFFQDEARQLCVYSLERDETTVLGPLQHNRSDLLPVLRLPDATVLAGTSFGQLVRFAPDGGVLARGAVGKRILTPFHREGDVVCFGTQGGAVLAWAWPRAERVR